MTILYPISASATLPSTFVFREIREIKTHGLDVVIGQLRPFNRPLAATGFEDLIPSVVVLNLFSRDLLRGVAYFAFRQPRRLLRALGLISQAFRQPVSFVKMCYVLLASVVFAYKCRNSKIGHVRAHFLHTEALAAKIVSELLQVPYSVTVHTIIAHYPRSVIEKITETAEFLVADTCQVREFLHSLSAKGSRVFLIRNGVRLEDFPPRIEYGIPDCPVVLAVGRLVLKKGFHVLLYACQLLRQRGIQFRCVIVGDGEERGKLAKLRQTLGLERNVELLGNLNFRELKDWYYRANVLVMPSIVCSDTDGLPTVVIEALASGLPVIGTDTGGIPEAVQNGITGLVVPANVAESIADRIQMLIENEDLGAQLGSNGRRLAEREFDLRRNMDGLVHLILENEDGVTTAVSEQPTPCKGVAGPN